MVNNADEIAELRRELAQLKQQVVQLQSPGPTTNYTPLNQSYTGANIPDGLINAGAGGPLAGGNLFQVRKQSDGSLLLWIGYSIDAGLALHQGIHILSLDAQPAAGAAYTAAEQGILNAILAALRA